MLLPFLLISLGVFGAVGLASLAWAPAAWLFVLVVPLFVLGMWDALQTRKAVLRNFPVIGHFRYLFEMIRPEIDQYFVESETDGRPIDRERRSIVYQRAKGMLDTLPFGTLREVYEPGYEWLDHSLAAHHGSKVEPRITIGGPDCKQPYAASLLNISAMSYGSLSSAAIRALNGGAKAGGFFHNTGEGGVSPHHLSPGGDLCYQVGTGYFGSRGADGNFDPDAFARTASQPAIKLIELKLSQGAKPGHGGILPAAKITDEISAIRGVPKGVDVLSPPSHSAFDGPRGLVQFIARLRDLSGGKPVGFKLCVGEPAEFVAICKAMVEESITPDFISVDGGEGGTGAAPLEFSNSVGSPLTDGLVLVHNALVGFGLRERIKIIASGKVITAFQMAQRLAGGADLINSARGFMLSLGCIQARRCNTNHCPVGVATQDPGLERGLVVADKQVRVERWHRETVEALCELLGAAGIEHPDQLRPHHIHRRLSHDRHATYAEIYEWLESGELLKSPHPDRWAAWMATSSTDSFIPVPIGTWKGKEGDAEAEVELAAN
jgi:glutamate synthase domain-containing protein 2